MTRLTEAQKAFLRWLWRDGSWRIAHIDRSGNTRHVAPIRQQCKRKGLAENNRWHKREWRITPAGRAALKEGRDE